MKCRKEMLLAIMVTAGFFGCLAFLLFKEFPSGNKDLLVSLLGVLTTIFTLIMNFFFGSSTASKAKDDTIAAAVNPPVKDGNNNRKENV